MSSHVLTGIYNGMYVIWEIKFLCRLSPLENILNCLGLQPKQETPSPFYLGNAEQQEGCKNSGECASGCRRRKAKRTSHPILNERERSPDSDSLHAAWEGRQWGCLFALWQCIRKRRRELTSACVRESNTSTLLSTSHTCFRSSCLPLLPVEINNVTKTQQLCELTDKL